MMMYPKKRSPEKVADLKVERSALEDSNLNESINHRQKIMTALNHRQALLDYTRAAKEIDSTIYVMRFDRISGTPSDFFMWEKWSEFAADVENKKQHTAPGDWNDSSIIEDFKQKLKPLFLETITEALCEIIVVYPDVTYISVIPGGILTFQADSVWCGMEDPSRYKIPEEIANILVRENGIVDFDFVGEVMKEWNRKIGSINCIGYYAPLSQVYIDIDR